MWSESEEMKCESPNLLNTLSLIF